MTDVILRLRVNYWGQKLWNPNEVLRYVYLCMQLLQVTSGGHCEVPGLHAFLMAHQ
jgi:hypothetical protein